MEGRLKVSEGEELLDLFAHYKARTFNPLHLYVVSYRGKMATDAGGLSRQLFTTVNRCEQRIISSKEMVIEGCKGLILV